MKRRDVRYLWTPSMRHGTDNAYSNGGCHCGECRRAHAEARREREHRSGRAYPWFLYLLHREDDNLTGRLVAGDG